MTRHPKANPIFRPLFLSFLLSLGFLLAPSPAQGGVSLINFQAGGIGVFPSGGTGQFFGQVAWTPYFGVGTVGVRGDLGITLLKNAVTGDRFLAINTEALLSLTILPGFSVDVGGGLHNWVSNGGTDLAVSANAVFTTIGVFDRVYVGYSRFFLAPGANEFRAGVGFTI